MPSRKSRLRAPIQVPASVVAARATAGARTMAEGTIGWFAGVDWGSQQQQGLLLDAAGKVVGERAFPHGGAGLAALCDWLMSMADDPGSVAVAIEVPHGPGVRHGSMRQPAAVEITATGDRTHGSDPQQRARGGAGVRPDR